MKDLVRIIVFVSVLGGCSDAGATSSTARDDLPAVGADGSHAGRFLDYDNTAAPTQVSASTAAGNKRRKRPQDDDHGDNRGLRPKRPKRPPEPKPPDRPRKPRPPLESTETVVVVEEIYYVEEVPYVEQSWDSYRPAPAPVLTLEETNIALACVAVSVNSLFVLGGERNTAAASVGILFGLTSLIAAASPGAEHPAASLFVSAASFLLAFCNLAQDPPGGYGFETNDEGSRDRYTTAIRSGAVGVSLHF